MTKQRVEINILSQGDKCQYAICLIDENTSEKKILFESERIPVENVRYIAREVYDLINPRLKSHRISLQNFIVQLDYANDICSGSLRTCVGNSSSLSLRNCLQGMNRQVINAYQGLIFGEVNESHNAFDLEPAATNYYFAFLMVGLAISLMSLTIGILILISVIIPPVAPLAFGLTATAAGLAGTGFFAHQAITLDESPKQNPSV